jgi:hypothetical protein
MLATLAAGVPLTTSKALLAADLALAGRSLHAAPACILQRSSRRQSRTALQFQSTVRSAVAATSAATITEAPVSSGRQGSAATITEAPVSSNRQGRALQRMASPSKPPVEVVSEGNENEALYIQSQKILDRLPKKQVYLFYCNETKELAERVAQDGENIELRDIDWK